MPAPESRFVYPRSIQNDVADALATCRARVASDELRIVDLVTKELLEVFFEHDPAFSSHVDAWARRARYCVDTPRNQQERS